MSDLSPLCAPKRTSAKRADQGRAACRMGLEGLVSKRRDRPYQAGRSKHWVKVKNRQHPAMERSL
jgi:bifunctional non-homologous end joining protein LigD